MTLEGASFDGYRLMRLLGRGGAGEVYLAEAQDSGPGDELVAVKVFRDAGGQPFARDLMLQAQSVAALQHPYILPCYTGLVQGHSLGIVMDYAPGGSLGDTLVSGQSSITLPLGASATARIVAQVARTLADVHARGITHGDLKPTNLFVRTGLSGETIVALSDFGHGFLAQAAMAALQQAGRGAPPEWAVEQVAWAAPEQFRRNAVPDSDQYSLAALAYFLLTGIRPVSADAQALLSGGMSGVSSSGGGGGQRGGAPRSIPPPSKLNPMLGDEVDAVLFHALAPQPQQRFDTIVEFARVLEDALTASDTMFGSASSARSRGGARRGAASSMTSNTATAASASRSANAAKPARAARRAGKPDKRTLAEMSYPAAPAVVSRRIPIVVDDEDLPDGMSDAPVRPRRRISTFLLLALLLALVVGGLGMFVAKAGRLDLARITSPNSAPTVQGSPSPQASAPIQAETRLRAALGGKAVYSDALTGSPAAWPTDGKSSLFGSDKRLHLRNSAKTPLFADMPTSAPMPRGAYVATVDVSLLKGKTSDHAGMRFLVSSSDKGDIYYSYLVTPEGRFELWLQHPDTGLVFLTSGFVPTLKTGLGQTNTLAVLIDPKAGTLTLFANGAFVYQAPIGGGIALTGRLGVLTPDSGVEAAFANFAVYNA